MIPNSAIVFRGPLTDVNAVGGYREIGQIFQGYRDIALWLSTSTDDDGYPSKIPDTISFFNTLESWGKPIWLGINMTAQGGGAAGRLAIKKKMDTYVSWFKEYNLHRLLRGFYLTNFDFASTYTDSQKVTRADQNFVLEVAHRDHRLPCWVQVNYVSDLFEKLGPQGRGQEQGLPLWPCIFGGDAVLHDMVSFVDPIITTWTSPSVGIIDLSKLAESMQATIAYTSNRNASFIPLQTFDLADAVYDNLLGLTIDAPTKAYIDNIARLIRACGFSFVGAQSRTLDTQSKVIHPSFLNKTYPSDNQDRSRLGNLWSDSGFIYVQNYVYVQNKLTKTVHKFNGTTLAYISST